MRLSERRKVDLPQPDGPISATTDRSGMFSEMSQSACFLPYQNDIPLTRNLFRTPGLAETSRPFRLRSERMAEYDRVDMEDTSSVPRAAGRPYRGAILWILCVGLMNVRGSFG